VRLRVFLDKCRNSQDDVHELQGKTVEVSGLVKLYKGKPEIVLESPSQLKTE
jgi:DNA/RNA endonuclease YhcR with UshA esterase domain